MKMLVIGGTRGLGHAVVRAAFIVRNLNATEYVHKSVLLTT
ncbi:MAG: hypothetical protein ABIO63_03385 [Casimicrobiaceae bacterium]